MAKIKNCLTEAIKHKFVFMLIYLDDGFFGIFYPHFIWKINRNYFYYTTSNMIHSRIYFDGIIKKLNLKIYREKRKFIILRIK